MSSMTEEQRRRMEDNRRRALEIKRQKDHTRQRQEQQQRAASSNVSSEKKTRLSQSHIKKKSVFVSPVAKSTVSNNNNNNVSIGERSNEYKHLSTSTSSNKNEGDDLKNILEEKKRRALELRAKKSRDSNSPVFPSLTETSLGANAANPQNKHLSKQSNPVPNSTTSSAKTTTPPPPPPKDLWSRIPESGVKSVAASVGYMPAKASESASSLAPPKVHPLQRTKVRFVLASKSRFKATMERFHLKAIDVFKTLEGREYDVENKTWSFPVRKHDTVVSQLTSICADLEVEPLPQFVLRALVEIRHKEEECAEDPDLDAIGPELLGKIYDFQRRGILTGIRNGGRILLADDMGLGKTVQAIGIAGYYRRDWPVLVVCPSSVRFQWNEAFANWLPELIVDLDTQVVVKGNDDIPHKRKVVITSYDLLAKTVRQRKYGVVILDESHYIKNEKTARTKAVIPVCAAAKRVLLLSGTPALSRPKELYTQINCLDSTMFKMFHEFGVRYCDARKNAWGWDYTGSSNMEELQILLEAHFMIRRTKSQVLDELPPKRRQVVHLDSSLIKRRSSLGAARRTLERANELHKKGDAHNALLEFFHETAEAKIQAVCQYLMDRIEGLPKFIVFAHHQNVLNSITDLLRSSQTKFIRIDGSTSAADRQDLARRFNNDVDCKAAVLSVMAANAGINMASASCVIFAEIMWNPGVMVQAEDRAHRIGQRDSVMVQYLLAAGTSDDHVWNLLTRKLSVLGKVGLASASDESFRGCAQEFQKKPSTQPTIDSFLEEIEDDDDLLRSFATQAGVVDFRSPRKSSPASLEESNRTENSREVKVQRTLTKSPTKKSPSKRLPLQRNTMDKYLSPVKKTKTRDVSEPRIVDGAGVRDDATTAKVSSSILGSDPFVEEEGFDWLDYDDDPFLSQGEANKRRRLN